MDYRILDFTLAFRLQNAISTVVSSTKQALLKIIVQGFFFLILEKHLIVLSGLFQSVVKKFNFGGQFIKWIKVL